MKLPQCSSDSLNFQKCGSRWQWMAGASAALGAAATGAAVAAPAQIALTGNQVSFSASNINADITGDGVVDLPNLNVFVRSDSRSTRVSSGKYYYSYFNRVAVNSGVGSAKSASFAGKRFGIASFFLTYSSTITNKSVRLGSNAPTFFYAYAGDNSGIKGSTHQSATAAIPVTFSDLRINSGSTTSGFLTVRAFNTNGPGGLHVVQFVHLAYDDVNATRRLSIKSKLKKLKKKLKNANESGKVAKIKKIKKQIKKEKKKLRALS